MKQKITKEFDIFNDFRKLIRDKQENLKKDGTHLQMGQHQSLKKLRDNLTKLLRLSDSHNPY